MPTNRKQRVRKHRHRGQILALGLALLFSGYVAWAYLFAPARTINAITPELAPYFDTGTVSLTWPSYGQAAVGTEAGGLLASHGSAVASPIASIAKTMTALAVLDRKPLEPGQSGPTITLTEADEEIYDNYFRIDGSITPVKAGVKVTELQALQAMLLPSANNYADTLAIWAFGSIEKYTMFANNYAKRLGMTSSHFADASGYSPQTVSTAPDLVKLGRAAMKNSVIAGIVGQSTAEIPYAGTVHNVNGMLRLNQGIIGIKTGNTDQAGGCMLVAMKYKFGSTDIVIISAVMGAPHLVPAMTAARDLAQSAKSNFINLKLVSKGQTFGTYPTDWGKSSQAVASADLSAVVWKGSNVQVGAATETIKPPAGKAQVVGQVTATGLALQPKQSVPLVLNAPLPGPSFWWRLTHPLASTRN